MALDGCVRPRRGGDSVFGACGCVVAVVREMTRVIGNTHIDRWTVSVNGADRMLTQQEDQLFRILLANQGVFVTREIVEAEMSRATRDGVSGKSVDILLHRVRRKLELLGSDIRIETRTRVGWRIANPMTQVVYSMSPLQAEAIEMCIEFATKNNKRIAEIARSAL